MPKVTSEKLLLTIDDLNLVETFGELTKLAIKLRMDATTQLVGDEEYDEERRYELQLERDRDEPAALEDEITNLFILWCVVAGFSGNHGLKELEQRVAARHFPLDRPIEDVMSIGGGPDHEGH